MFGFTGDANSGFLDENCVLIKNKWSKCTMLVNLIHIFNIQYKTTATLNFLYTVQSYGALVCVCLFNESGVAV